MVNLIRQSSVSVCSQVINLPITLTNPPLAGEAYIIIYSSCTMQIFTVYHKYFSREKAFLVLREKGNGKASWKVTSTALPPATYPTFLKQIHDLSLHQVRFLW